ncbi:MAG: SRPBCC family protein [Planctomycetota bacterium]
MKKKIALAVAALIVVPILAILGYAATKPDAFKVQRSITINAPAEQIFPLINDLHSWEGWSPFEKLDPAAKRTFSGPSIGPGSSYEWAGNSQIGKGKMEITESASPSKVLINLSFKEPFEGQAVAEFSLKSQGEGTTVTWAMTGVQPYMGKVMSVFIDCDSMVGKDFETGLATLKKVSETASEKTP